MRVAVIGPGAVGGTIAFWLAQDPRLTVELWARTRFDELRVETPDGPRSCRPRVVLDPAEASSPSWVILATKAYDVASAAPWLAVLDGRARVAVLQNGVEHVERLQPYLDPARVVAAVVDCAALRLGPGTIRQRRHAALIVNDDPNGRDLATLFSGTPVTVTLTADLVTAAWKKLCFNIGGTVCALTGQPAGITWRSDVAELLRDLVREGVAVGRAEGATLEDELPESILEGHRKAPRDAVNSLLADRLAGRRMEVDARNGVVVRRGRAHGVQTPLNAMAVAILEAAGPAGLPAG